MKKFLAIALTLASVGFTASTAEAKAANPSNSVASAPALKAAPAAAQWRNRNRNRNRGRVRVTTQSRLVRVGRRVYRETYQIRYLPNGRTQTRLISRVRVR